MEIENLVGLSLSAKIVESKIGYRDPTHAKLKNQVKRETYSNCSTIHMAEMRDEKGGREKPPWRSNKGECISTCVLSALPALLEMF